MLRTDSGFLPDKCPTCSRVRRAAAEPGRVLGEGWLSRAPCPPHPCQDVCHEAAVTTAGQQEAARPGDARTAFWELRLGFSTDDSA